ncbi:MAG: PIN domain-containing protein [Dolichospermum sp.]|jgi:tRNA(fMet)-specific endonuclease VapC|nr:PIN domain-containing protein [Anabaena sp. 49628_E55]
MIYLLDTNTCIIYLKGKNIHLKEKLDSISISEIAVCSIVKSELFYGAMRSAKPESNLKLQQGFLDKFVSLPFNDEAAIIFGNIRAELTSKGTPIGGYDLQIAAIALANNLILVTPHMNRNFIFLTIQYYLT